MNDSRTVLRDLTIALGVLALVFAGLYGWSHLETDDSGPTVAFGDPAVPPMAVAPPEPEPEEDEAILRYVVDSHTVVGGESFSLITGMYWDDIFLWPDLWVHNEMSSGDPDLIYPDEIVDIYNRLGKGDDYTEAERDLILQAYLEVYDRFKAIGPEKNGSAWTLLWCGAKYDHAFLDRFAHRIDPEDLAVARRYVEEEGFLD